MSRQIKKSSNHIEKYGKGRNERSLKLKQTLLYQFHKIWQQIARNGINLQWNHIFKWWQQTELAHDKWKEEEKNHSELNVHMIEAMFSMYVCSPFMHIMNHISFFSFAFCSVLELWQDYHWPFALWLVYKHEMGIWWIKSICDYLHFA